MTEFALIRHGETDWNAQGRLQGRSDIELNETGRAQARLAANGLRDEPWDVVIASPLTRAFETALIIARELGIDEREVTSHLDLRERFYGLAEGLSVAERSERFPDNLWPDAETPQEMDTRTGAIMYELARQYAGKRVLIVTHGGWIRSALRVLSGYDRSVHGVSIPNASRTIILHDERGWQFPLVAIGPDER